MRDLSPFCIILLLHLFPMGLAPSVGDLHRRRRCDAYKDIRSVPIASWMRYSESSKTHSSCSHLTRLHSSDAYWQLKDIDSFFLQLVGPKRHLPKVRKAIQDFSGPTCPGGKQRGSTHLSKSTIVGTTLSECCFGLPRKTSYQSWSSSPPCPVWLCDDKVFRNRCRMQMDRF